MLPFGSDGLQPLNEFELCASVAYYSCYDYLFPTASSVLRLLHCDCSCARFYAGLLLGGRSSFVDSSPGRPPACQESITIIDRGGWIPSVVAKIVPW